MRNTVRKDKAENEIREAKKEDKENFKTNLCLLLSKVFRYILHMVHRKSYNGYCMKHTDKRYNFYIFRMTIVAIGTSIVKSNKIN